MVVKTSFSRLSNLLDPTYKMWHSDQTQCEYSLCILSEHSVSSCLQKSVSSCSGAVNILVFLRSAQVIEFQIYSGMGDRVNGTRMVELVWPRW